MSEEIDAVARRMWDIRTEQGDLQEEEDLLWERFFEICDDVKGENRSYKYVIPPEHPIPGLSIAREMHQSSPKLNVDALKASLSTFVWKLITRTERVLDMEKLETSIARGDLDAKLVDEHTEYKDPVPHKKFGMATKKDLKDVQRE